MRFLVRGRRQDTRYAVDVMSEPLRLHWLSLDIPAPERRRVGVEWERMRKRKKRERET